MFLFFHDSGEAFVFPFFIAFHLVNFFLFFRTIYLVVKKKSKIALKFGIIALSFSSLLLIIYNISHDFISATLSSILFYPFGFLWGFCGGTIFLDAMLNNYEPAYYDQALLNENLSPNVSFLLTIINIYFFMNIIEVVERKIKRRNLRNVEVYK